MSALKDEPHDSLLIRPEDSLHNNKWVVSDKNWPGSQQAGADAFVAECYEPRV